MSKEHDEKVTQALAQVARLGGYTLKKVSTTDDLTNRTLTITLAGISAGFVQEALDFEREDLTYRVNGRNGHVDAVEHPPAQPGDLAETEAEANAEIAAAAEAELPSAPGGDEPDGAADPNATPFEPHLVGELAGAARGNKKKR